MNKFTHLLIIVLLGMFSQFVMGQVERSQLTSCLENREPTDNLEGLVQGQNDKIQRVYFLRKSLARKMAR